jgi:hypothetical protein
VSWNRTASEITLRFILKLCRCHYSTFYVTVLQETNSGSLNSLPCRYRTYTSTKGGVYRIFYETHNWTHTRDSKDIGR